MMLEDLCVNSWSLCFCCMVLVYCIVYFCFVWCKKNVLNNLWVVLVLVLYCVIMECLFGYEIQVVVIIGWWFIIYYGYVVVINKYVVVGDDFIICYGVIIGNCGVDSLVCLVIGNGVELGVNVILFGDIIIGNYVMIGVGSVVFDSILDYVLVVGEKVWVKVSI